MSQLLHLALLSRGAADAPRTDKTRWDLAFSYKSIPCELRFTVFGIKLYIWVTESRGDEPSALALDIEQKLRSAVKTIQTMVVEPAVEMQRQTNNVRVLNQHGRYAGFVSYFRAKLNEALENDGQPGLRMTLQPPHEPSDRLEGDLMNIAGGIQVKLDREHEIAYLATALLAGYFSLVQHRLVLLTGFSAAALEDDFSVDRLFSASWSDQFSLATTGRMAAGDKVAHSDLSYLAREYRNTLLHGGGGRLADGIFVEWAPGYHTIETARGVFTDQFMLWQPALTPDQAKDVVSIIDRIEAWFTSLPYFPWLESGLPVGFDNASVQLALDNLKEGTVAQYIEHKDSEFDYGMNG
ncbi:hypothetical protein [Antrihabitans sp. YC2-6]|uniref:hypothetical protein n=1 Tax=Antrihabitans sp. YC2-6 TaxID=2799498 RepID=UPI0018F30A43|nr:hypothetical protein [Antrihabitans sp. YC2-6]MBJ8348271.1 hypothetical protein [Antrihabitans sp. YC2-6]